MKFHEHASLYQQVKRDLPKGSDPLATYDRWMMRGVKLANDDGTTTHIHPFHPGAGVISDPYTRVISVEYAWYEHQRAYYKLWPAMIEPLNRIRLNRPANQITLPDDCLLVRYPVGHEPRHGTSLLEYVLFAKSGDVILAGMGLADIEEPGARFIQEVYFRMDHDTNIDDYIGEMTVDISDPVKRATLADQATRVIRLIVCVLAMKNDPLVVTRDVLVADQKKFDESGDHKYVQKAQRRGVNGHSIGKDMTITPHYRGPHFSIRWCGPGRREPRLRPIRASWVHRQRMTEVPTGYYSPDDKELEPIHDEA